MYVQFWQGMDPAGPLYEGHPVAVRLDSTDAMFVDAIHTNAAPLHRGGAGLMDVSGHVDFYLNGGMRQPGCPNFISGSFTELIRGKLEGEPCL